MIKTDYITKQEYDDVEKVTKFIKIENEAPVKKEDAQHPPPFCNYYNPYLMNMPQIPINMPVNLQGMNPMNMPMPMQMPGMNQMQMNRMMFNNMAAINNMKLQMMAEIYRRNSTNQTSAATKTTSTAKKPFTILRNSKPQKVTKINKPSKLEQKFHTFSPSIKTEDSSDAKQPVRLKMKSIRVSACKNYIGLLCAGFARTVLTAGPESDVIAFIRKLFTIKKKQFESLKDHQEEELVESLKRYIYNNMCGKKIKKSNRERDFKIRNTEELDALLVYKEDDKETTSLRKQVLRDLVTFFFESECYSNWLKRGMMSETNRLFFVKNREELHKKFLAPCTYKPRFTHSMREPTVNNTIFD